MTKLSQELNECPNSSPDLNGVIENNPIYVTSVPDLHNATLERLKQSKPANEDPITAIPPDVGGPALATNSQHDVIQDLDGQELELKQEIIESRDLISDTPVPSPLPSTAVVQSQNSLHFDYRSEQLCDKLHELEAEQNCLEQNQPGHLCSKTEMMEIESRKHRERAVDVPDTFIAVTKTPPRYPPPKSSTLSDVVSRRRGSPPEPPVRTTSAGLGKMSAPAIPTTTDVNKTGELKDSSPSLSHKPPTTQKPQINGKSSPRLPRQRMNGVAPLDVSGNRNSKEEQMERIRRYQEDIKRRKEEEERIAREEEFLRTSLRGSKKLQALEDNPPSLPQTGIINTAFQLEEGDTGTLQADYPLPRGVLVGKVENDRAEKDLPELTKILGPEDLLHSLKRLEVFLWNNGHKGEDLEAINSLIKSAVFQNVLSVHNKVQEVWCFDCPCSPLCSESSEAVQEVISVLQECSLPEAAELMDILSKYEFEGLIYSHDKIAERLALPAVSPDEELLDRASQYTEESVKIVRIDKTNEPLGATVRNEGESVIIGRIVKGGAAEKSGLLHEGDEVLEVNGMEMRGKSVNEVCDILATMTGTLTFLIIPSQYEPPKSNAKETVMHVKAHFDYDPDDDLYIPCRELGISFQKGDILHVINQDDGNWWQAYREGEEDQTLAGLIPSKSFQQQREAMKQTIVGESNSREKSKKGKFLCAKKNHKKKKKKIMYNGHYGEDFDSEQIVTYEEVSLYYPRANRKRPVVLIGPPNIGRHELRQKLMEDTDRFAAAVPHTSRPKREGEVDGMDYYFITRQQFEADIVGGKFVEHGEYEKNYYGTSLEAIRTVVNSGKICVLNLHPQSLKILKYSNLKPYVVFVAPPSLEKLRQNRAKMGTGVKDEELKDIIEKAREMEENYGHYFDMIIINSEIDKAYTTLLKEMNTLEREPQWVPAIWLKSDMN